MEKSGEHVIPLQIFTPELVQADQIAPPLTEKYILALMAVAASLEKSDTEVIPYHCSFPAPVRAVQLMPLSLDK
jgi:hypothetical protein